MSAIKVCFFFIISFSTVLAADGDDDVPDDRILKGVVYVFMGVVAAVLFVFICAVRDHIPSVLSAPELGLDEIVIQAYPKVVLGDSVRLAKPEDDICSVCLSEYQAREILKTIPGCKHCFHADCIDQWLRKNGTCPLCRSAPKSLATPIPS